MNNASPSYDIRRGEIWQAFVDGGTRDSCARLILSIAGRLSDPGRIEREIAAARSRTRGLYLWHPASLSNGYAGISIFYRYLAEIRPNEGWEKIAYQYIRLAVASTHEGPLDNLSLFSGCSGLAFALQSLAELDDRYQPSADRLADIVAVEAAMNCKIHNAAGPRLADEREFDVISGAAGVLAFLLTVPKPSASVAESIRILTSRLARFASASVDGEQRPWTVHSRTAREHGPVSPSYNTGLAHGVLGVGVALAEAAERGYAAEDISQSIDNVYSWFAETRIESDARIDWPYEVPALASAAGDYLGRAGRASWCYGTGGASRALWRASGDSREHFRALGLRAIRLAARSSPVELGLNNPGLCHGAAGLLLVFLRFANDLGSDEFSGAIERLITAIIKSCEENLPFFVQDTRPDGEKVDEAGLLTGAAGVALALLAGSTAVEPRWDRLLLLS